MNYVGLCCSISWYACVCVCACACVCTNRKVGEHTESALQESDQVYQVVAGLQIPASLHGCHPIVISQLQELVDLGV